MKLRDLIPNSYIHVFVCDFYIYMQQNRWTRLWEYINRSQIHECGSWEQGRAVSFLGIHKSDLVCSAYLLSETFFLKEYFSMLCCL
jgi:hypothetical protein